MALLNRTKITSAALEHQGWCVILDLQNYSYFLTICFDISERQHALSIW